MAPTVCVLVTLTGVLPRSGSSIPLRYSVLPTQTHCEIGNVDPLGSGTRISVFCAGAASGARARAANATAVRMLSNGSSGADLVPYQVNRTDGRQRRALLPSDDVAGVVAGEVDAAIRARDDRIVLRLTPAEAADPGTQIEGDIAPAHINGI